MAEYIDRKALKNDGHLCYHDGKGNIYYEVDHAPAVDVVEVVRCKECKNAYINSFSAQSGIALCRFWTNRANGEQAIMQQDDYCSYGERK